jgi:hypothetical protein
LEPTSILAARAWYLLLRDKYRTSSGTETTRHPQVDEGDDADD